MDQKTETSKLYDVIVPGYAPWPISRYELELAIQESDPDKSLLVVTCNGELPFCPVRDNDKISSCEDCIKTRKKQLKIFQKLSNYNSIKEISIDKFTSDIYAKVHDKYLTDQKIYSLSTLYTEFKSTDYNDVNILHDLQANYALGLLIGNHLLKHYTINQFLIFNGRISFYRSFFSVAKENEKRALVYEVPMIGRESFIVMENYLKIDRPKWSHNLKIFLDKYKENSTDANLNSSGLSSQDWFDRRINYRSDNQNSGQYNNKSYLPSEVQNKIPKTLHEATEGKIVVFFVSSDFELLGIPEVEDHFEVSQKKVVEWLVEKTQIGEFSLIIRMHPNLKNGSRKDINEYMRHDGGAVSVISPSEPIDSYALARSADVVISYGSTIGLEASYMNCYSVVCGTSYYQAFNIAPHVQSLCELDHHIKSNQIVEKASLHKKQNCIDVITAIRRFSRPINHTKVFYNVQMYQSKFRFGFLMPTSVMFKKLLKKVVKNVI